MAALYRRISLLNRLTVRLWMDCQRRSAAAWSLSFAIRRQNSLSAIVDRASTGTGGWGTLYGRQHTAPPAVKCSLHGLENRGCVGVSALV